MSEQTLMNRLANSLQETRILAAVSYEGDPWYAEEAGLDALAILRRARDVLEDAEEHRASESA